MSGFKALNIESDDESDVEIDDTKELQIEEALKLYQIALKLHSEGPDSFAKAAKAYEELFESEIFQYPESQNELRRIELYGPVLDAEDAWQDGIGDVAVLPTTSLETGPSTLPQILHLSHKNYAQFKLEYLTARLPTFNVTLSQILSDASAALNHFVDALDKDDTDLDLWRRTAGVGSALESRRVARFCLEAVLDGDEDGLSSALSLPGLDEGLAGVQLRELIGELEDRLSILQSPLSTSKRRVLSKMLKQRLNSYEDIEDRQRSLRNMEVPPSPVPAERIRLQTPTEWAEVGDILLRQLMAEQHGTSTLQAGLAISFDLDSAMHSNGQQKQQPRKANEDEAVFTRPNNLPTSIDEQFPGLDHGQPTVQPRIACADTNMHLLTLSSTDDDVALTRSPTMTLPSRKRSGDVAGLNDSPEEGRTKSKRTRTRDSAMTEDSRQAMIDANARWELEQKLAELQAADDWMFETVGNLFERIGIVGFETGKNVRQELQSPLPGEGRNCVANDGPKRGLQLAKQDIQAFLTHYSDRLAKVLTAGGDTLDIAEGPISANATSTYSNGTGSKALSKPSLPPEDGLLEFLHGINRDYLRTQEAAWSWIGRLLRPAGNSGKESYREYVWPEKLKTMIVRTLVNFDESFHRTASEEISHWNESSEQIQLQQGTSELIQAVFELHLDIYWLIKESNSGVDAETIAAQSDRLQRWAELAREVVHRRQTQELDSATMYDELSLRFFWATTFQIGADPQVSQDYVIECMHDLRAIVIAADEPIIYLSNNAIMPEISLAALDRQISRLTTKDFFDKVTSQDATDPVAIIESLEPLLESLVECRASAGQQDDAEHTPVVSSELTHFLENSDISVRLLLWQRLRKAYLSIDYKPMVVSCYFKMVKMLLSELDSTLSTDTPQPDRQVAVLKSLRLIHDMISKTMLMIQNKDALECIDEDGLKTAIYSFGKVLHLLQVFNISEDSIRIGQSQPPDLTSGSSTTTFAALNALVHNMQVHVWVILYTLLKDSIFQFHDLFPAPAEDMFEFLKVVHRNLGLRGICGSSNRVFVRLVKDEFFQMTHIEGYESEQAQVLYDLYGLNCFLNPSYELMEHSCIHDAFIDRSVALQAVDLLLLQASKLPMKELIKHPIKDTIDKVHAAAPRKKPTEAIIRNREVQRAFLRSSINPLDLYNCLKGEGNQLNVSRVPREDALLAAKGWYFLMGHVALAKFRSQKRTAPTPTEDVDIAIAFFMQDLEYSPDNWETWFRLAQAYDTKIEESVVWSAEKLNNSMTEIAQLQRAAIHCFTMATALAYRSADLTFETSEKMTELFSDFAMRLYASSREPFSMLPFALDDDEKFLSIQGRGMSKGKAFEPLRVYTAWKLAKVFFQKALAGKPDSWTLYFALGKCLWKMHAADDRTRGQRHVVPTAQQVLANVARAIELIPDKKDSREKREPVLEPHYKLVSIVHKMVIRNDLTLDEAREALQNTPYARNVAFPAQRDDWVPYVLAVLKNLRTADKSNWHHRMIARAAQIIYDDSDSKGEMDAPSGRIAALGAKHELTQQMFTKTMVLQVWRPECERAGRHFVYTSRYTRFFVRILEQLKDRSSLEMLARRMRRRPHDLFEHATVWQEICYAYLRLLRGSAALPEGLETSTFSTIAHEDFLLRKEPLEKWMQIQDPGSTPALDVLREVQELKKINQSLMKPAPIDDLIGDSYAYLFNTIGKQLLEAERRIKHEEEAQRAPPVSSPPRNSMMSLTNVMNVDGAPDTTMSDPTVLPAQPSDAVADIIPIRRKIGVGRREIRTCAEACVQKANTAPTQATPRALPRVQVVIDSSKENLSGFASVETSAPGSVYSADDESELSELEEEEEGEEEGHSPSVKKGSRLMFPGLLSEGASGDVSEGFETGEEEPPAEIEAAEVEMADVSSVVEGTATEHDNVGGGPLAGDTARDVFHA